MIFKILTEAMSRMKILILRVGYLEFKKNYADCLIKLSIE